jgi:HK97 family phage prohead protease/HK97 family phage major capsid protein
MSEKEPEVRVRHVDLQATVERRDEDDDTRTRVTGYGVKWDSRNSYGETFVPGAFEKTLATRERPLPMAEGHRQALGVWTDPGEDDIGLLLDGRISDTTHGRDTATLIEDGALTGLSIGFRPLLERFAEAGEKVEFDTPDGKRSYTPDRPTFFVLEAQLVEASIVLSPSDDDARVESIRARQEAERMVSQARQERANQDTDPTEGRHMSEENEGTPAAAGGAESEAVTEIAVAVRELAASVKDTNKTQADTRQMVENMREDLAEAQKRHAEAVNASRGGVDDEDTEDTLGRSLISGDYSQRMAAIHQRDAERVAPLIRRDAADVREFHERADSLLLLEACLKATDPQVDVRDTSYYQEEYLPALRAMDTATSGEGAEWVPTDLSSTLIDRVNLPLMVLAQFPMIPMPTNPYEVPGRAVARTRLGSHAEQTGDSSQTKFKVVTPGSRKVTLTAKKFAGRALVSREAEEDAIVAMLPFLQNELVDFLTADLEDAAINGDTTGTHQDSDTTDADDPRKNWDGLRDIALNGLTNGSIDGGNAALTLAMLRANRKSMGKYGTRVGGLFHLMGLASYIDLLSDSNFQTVEKYGANATVLTGELGRADGIPVVVSEYAREDLNASGVYDATTTNRGAAFTVWGRGIWRGSRRSMTLETLRELYAESDQDAVILSKREAFEQAYPNSENVVAVTYNLSS